MFVYLPSYTAHVLPEFQKAFKSHFKNNELYTNYMSSKSMQAMYPRILHSFLLFTKLVLGTCTSLICGQR